MIRLAQAATEDDGKMNNLDDQAKGKLNEKLVEAVKNGDKKNVLISLIKGADLESKNDYRGTAFHVAASKGFDDILEILLQHGQDINMKGGNDLTAISYAAAYGKLSTVKFLGDKGALLDLQDGDGDTALTNAAAGNDGSGNPEVVAELLKLGADPTIQTKKGLTAEQKARDAGNNDVVSVLESWGNPEVGKKNMMAASMPSKAALVRALISIGIEKEEFELSEEQIKFASGSGDLEGFKALIADAPDWLLQGLLDNTLVKSLVVGEDTAQEELNHKLI